MASGVAVDEDVVKCFNDMKMKRPFDVDGKKKKLKALVFCVSQDKKTIIVEEGMQLYDGDEEDPFKCLKSKLPPKNCRYVLYDFCYDTRESKKEELAFFTWSPDCGSIKDKMLYASSTDCLKKKLSGLRHYWQINDSAEMTIESVAEKLGCDVVCLEGHNMCGHHDEQQQQQQSY